MTDPAILPSQIHAVTVHADGALVRRRIPLDGVTGQPGLVRILGLPLAAAGRPVRARVCDGGTEVLSCRLVPVTGTPGAADDRVLEKAVEAATEVVTAAEGRVEAALARLNALNVLEPPARPDGVKGQPPPASPAAARYELLRFRDSQAERLFADLAAARTEQEQAAEHQAQAEAALEQASTARAARSEELRLAADLQLRWPATGAPGWIELDYIVPGARWAPSYVLRFDRELGRVAIQLRGLVAQRSGEDWAGVRISCATAPLQNWCELPRLPGRRIGRAQPPLPSGWRPAPSGAEALFADWDAFTVGHPLVAPQAVFGRRSGTLGAIAASIPCEITADTDDCVERCADEICAPPPPSAKCMPPPCPSPAPAMEMMKEKRDARQIVAGAACQSNASIAPSRSRSPVKAKKSKAMANVTSSLSESDDLDQEEATDGSEPGNDLLDFAALRLAEADTGMRGRPRPGAGLGEDPRWRQACSAASRRSSDLQSIPPGHAAASPAHFAVRWEGNLPIDVPADGAWHVVPLAEAASPVQLGLVVVPRESRTAFRNAALSNPFDRALIAGPADVYIGADFLLTARLPDIGPGAGTAIGLGVDQTLAVARNATFAEETAGMLGGSLHLRHEVRISLHNKGGRAAPVEVRERLPQPDHGVEHCTVKQLKAEPPWEEWRPAEAALPGGHRWTMTLAAGEKRELVYEYRVEIQAKNELVGGNRREA